MKRCPSNGRVLKNETERQTVSSTRGEQDTPEALPVKRSSSREQDRETNGLINARGTRHTVKLCPSNDRLSRTRTRDKRSHRRAGNKTHREAPPVKRSSSRTRTRDKRSHRRAGNKNPEHAVQMIGSAAGSEIGPARCYAENAGGARRVRPARARPPTEGRLVQGSLQLRIECNNHLRISSDQSLLSKDTKLCGRIATVRMSRMAERGAKIAREREQKIPI